MSNKNYKDDDENKSWSSWGLSNAKNAKQFSKKKTSLGNESAAKHDDEPATKKTKSEERGLFGNNSEENADLSKPSLLSHVKGHLNLPPRPESSSQNPTSKTSSPKRQYMYRSPSKALSPLIGGPISEQTLPVYSSPDSQLSVFSSASGLTGRSQNTDGTSGFVEMQKQMEQQQKDIEIWKQIVNKKESNKKRLKNIIKILDDHKNTFEYKNGMVAYYLLPSDTSGSDASSEQAEEEEEEEEIEKTAAEEEGTDDNLKDVFNDEKSESDSEPTPDAIKNFTQNLQDLHNEVDKSKNPLEKEALESKFNKMNNELIGLLNQEEITAQNLEALFDPTKMNCEENDDDCSLISKTTIMLMKNETIMKLRGNRTLEDVNRKRNITNIIDSILKNDDIRQIHLDSGKTREHRDITERFVDTDKQFLNVWGGASQPGDANTQSRWAKEKCCYLCGGENISNGITSPEMEHKLPSLEFYTKVHNINEYYPKLVQAWQQYVDNNLQSIQSLYQFINCNSRSWVNDPKLFIEPQFNRVLTPFQDENNSNEDISKFIALLKVYLMEFAYSHHTCNQLKSNDNLNDPKVRLQYIKSVQAARPDRKQDKSLLKSNKLAEERSNINMDNKTFDNIGGHMSLINDYIGDYALLLYRNEARNFGKTTDNTIKEYCLKKIMVQSVKRTVNFLIEYKNKEKRKNAAKRENNQSEQYIDMLDILDNLKEVSDEYKGKSGRAQSLYTKRTSQDAYSKSNKYNLFLDKMDILDDNNTVKKIILYGKTDDITDDHKNLEDMEIDTMYNNLRYSDMFKNLLAAYNAKKFQNLSNYLDKYVSKEGGKNKTKKNKPKNETRRIKIKSNRKTRRRRSNNKSKKQK